MAFKFRGKKKKGTSVRLTGLFKTKRRGLFVGSMTELDPLKDKIRQAIKDDKGLVFFLWKNDDTEGDGPPFTISMDVSSDDDRPKGGAKKRRPEPEDEDEDEVEPEETDDDDEVPF